MRLPALSLAVTAAAAVLAGAAVAGPAQEQILRMLADQAKATPAAFSAERGKAFFLASHGTGKPDTPACISCHDANPAKAGRTRAGKEIAPMAVSANPKRFTDPAEVEKWFGRNCDSVLGRPCTATEKGDVITWLNGQ